MGGGVREGHRAVGRGYVCRGLVLQTLRPASSGSHTRAADRRFFDRSHSSRATSQCGRAAIAVRAGCAMRPCHWLAHDWSVDFLQSGSGKAGRPACLRACLLTSSVVLPAAVCSRVAGVWLCVRAIPFVCTGCRWGPRRSNGIDFTLSGDHDLVISALPLRVDIRDEAQWSGVHRACWCLLCKKLTTDS